MLALHDAQARGEACFSVSTQLGLAVPHPCHQGQLSDNDKLQDEG